MYTRLCNSIRGAWLNHAGSLSSRRSDVGPTARPDSTKQMASSWREGHDHGQRRAPAGASLRPWKHQSAFGKIAPLGKEARTEFGLRENDARNTFKAFFGGVISVSVRVQKCGRYFQRTRNKAPEEKQGRGEGRELRDG